MEDIEKILPILLIAAYYIFSAVQSAKKKKESDLSKTMLPKGIPRMYSQTTISPPEIQLSEYQARPIVQPEVVNPEVLRTVSSEVLSNRILEEEEEFVTAFEINAGDTNELRRAIIYSEILKQKY